MLSFLIQTSFAKKLYLGGDVAYYNGGALSLKTSYLNLSPNLPIGVSGGFGYSYQSNPGDANDARKIFINDATGGTVEENGNFYYFFLNLNYKVYEKRKIKFLAYAGLRYMVYHAHFSFIGDNEEFEIKTRGIGYGLGMESHVPINRNTFLSINLGLDYYPKYRLDGHSKYYYNPDGKDDNPRDGYSYSDADAAINQPKVLLDLRIGLNFKVF